MIKSKRLRANILLFIAAVIWGTAFVAQKEGVDVLHPCTYNGIRSFVGAIALIPVILITDAGKKKNGAYRSVYNVEINYTIHYRRQPKWKPQTI